MRRTRRPSLALLRLALALLFTLTLLLLAGASPARANGDGPSVQDQADYLTPAQAARITVAARPVSRT